MKAPKVKLSILKIPGGFAGLLGRVKAWPTALIGRIRNRQSSDASATPDAAPTPDDDDGIPSYLKQTFSERHGQKIALIGAYLVFLIAIGGTALYLILNEEALLEAEKERRPSLTIEELRPEIVRIDEAPEEDEATAEASGEPANDGAGEPTGDPTGDPTGEPSGEPEEELAMLAPHPDPALIEDSPTGPLPIIGADGRMPWRVYSRPHNALETRPQIAVVITDLGVADATTEQAIKMPAPITLAFAPYGRKLPLHIALARENGHEVMLTLPMEPRDFPRSDPGPYALMTSLDQDANMERLNWILSRATGYIGVTNYQGTAFTANQRSLRPIMTALAQRGLIYFDTREDPTIAAARTAEIAGAPATAADVVGDDDLTRAGILRKLGEAEVVANAQKTAVLLIRPYPVVMGRVRSWAEGLEEKGIVLAPLSAVIRARAGGS